MLDELRRIIEDGEIMQEDDAAWPQPDRVGRQVYVHLNPVCILLAQSLQFSKGRGLDQSLCVD